VTILLGDDGEQRALALDAEADAAMRRSDFAIPSGVDGGPVAYFAGNSLGLQPRHAADAVRETLDAWAALGVEGHTRGTHPWIAYHDELRDAAARVVGARPGEAVIMNTLTVNLHTMLSTFWQPAGGRFRIVVEHDAFPSDRYAVDSHAQLLGLEPDDAVIKLVPSDPGVGITVADVEGCLAEHEDSILLVMLGGINFRTGALLDIQAITEVVRGHGALAGWDLAHVAGNVPLQLHDWDVDFAVWCTYKYLNAGPGSLGGCFVHERWGARTDLPRPSGWWGNDPETRFEMTEHFTARRGTDGWQVSNPPILSMAAVRGSLSLFDEVGMPAIRDRSLRLTGFLEQLLDEVAGTCPCRIVTPRDPARRGAQLSVEVADAALVTKRLASEHGVIADDRPPNIVRFAPAPLYTTFHDCWRAATALREVMS
jgi:kynureninase